MALRPFMNERDFSNLDGEISQRIKSKALYEPVGLATGARRMFHPS